MKHFITPILLFFSFVTFSQTISLEEFATGFTNPVEIANANDNRLFIVEQAGRIKILNQNGTTNTTPFLNISNLVSSGGERGLLGLAFAPDYATTGRFYVNYTNTSGNTTIARYTVSANPDIANTSGTILLTINQPYSNHNGGKIAFGNDGFLYISTGDGGASGDPGNRAQNNNQLLGKLLRIDVSGTSYTNPTSNPFYGATAGLDEIWAYGLRNSWKFSFDKQNGNLWIADVGQYNYEEINRTLSTSTGGENYGWNCREGMHNYSGSACGSSSAGFIEPIAEYTHAGGKCSITGGYVYRGTNYNNFIGNYFFADYCSGEIGFLSPNGSNWDINIQSPTISGNWTTFGEATNGELFIAGTNGKIYHITDSDLGITNPKQLVFHIFPNPASKNITIKTNSNTKINSLQIFNLLGKSIKALSGIDSNAITVSVKNWQKGVYFFQISTTNNQSILKKITVN